MHIPDGYLGPQTCLATYGIMAPLWLWASRTARRTLSTRRLPLLALGAAFAFVLMLFNIPVPGGTTGHAVGGVLVAILLGPWAALIALSVTLAVQALLFGDGGVTTLAANCLVMGVLMPFAGYWTYRLVAGGSEATSRRRWLAAGLGGYVGLNAAAAGAAILFGIQPALAHDAAGRALYCPFSLDVALPAMALSHLLLLGFVEAAVTGMVVAYLSRVDPELLGETLPEEKDRRGSRWKKIALGGAVVLVLVAVGLYVSSTFGVDEAWGEWDASALGERAGYVPSGLARLEGFWHAPFPDYEVPGQGSAPSSPRAGNLASGVLVTVGFTGLLLLVKRLLARRGAHGRAA